MLRRAFYCCTAPPIVITHHGKHVEPHKDLIGSQGRQRLAVLPPPRLLPLRLKVFNHHVQRLRKGPGPGVADEEERPPLGHGASKVRVSQHPVSEAALSRAALREEALKEAAPIARRPRVDDLLNQLHRVQAALTNPVLSYKPLQPG